MPGFNLNLSDFPHSFIAPHPPPAFVIPLHELPVPQLSHMPSFHSLCFPCCLENKQQSSRGEKLAIKMLITEIKTYQMTDISQQNQHDPCCCVSWLGACWRCTGATSSSCYFCFTGSSNCTCMGESCLNCSGVPDSSYIASMPRGKILAS